jgi:hypothetical protein
MIFKKDQNKNSQKITHKAEESALKIKNYSKEQLAKLNNSVSNAIDATKDVTKVIRDNSHKYYEKAKDISKNL